MTTLYRYDVSSLHMTPWLSQGSPITVDGTPMVRLCAGVIVSADGFTPDIAEAKSRAADRLEELVQPVLARIAELRSGASA